MIRKWLALGFLAAAGGVFAQQPTQGFGAGVEVRVVNVEVMVTDASGAPVPNLLPDDFEVFEDGKLVRLTNFYRIVDGTAQLDAAQKATGFTPEDERFRRRLLLVVDNNFLDELGRRKALEQVRDFVAERFGGDAEWAVAAIGEQLQYLMPFTRERFQVAAALDEIEKLPTYAFRHTPDRALQNDPVRSQYLQTGEQGSSNVDIGAEYRFMSREIAMRNLKSFATMTRTLSSLMRSYGAFGGRKAVVLVSGKMEFHPEFQYLVSADPKTSRDTGLTDRVQSDPAIDGAKRDLEGVLAALVRAANSSGFQLYTLNAAGLTNPMRMHDVDNRQLGRIKNIGSFSALPDVSDADTAPLTLSEGTGGLALRSNSLGHDLARVMTDTSAYYSLGYDPGHAPDRAYHKITVKVNKPGLKVRSREGYLDLSDEEKLAEELGTPLSFPKPKGSLPVTLTVVEQVGEAGEFHLEARAAVPMKSLTLVPIGEGGELGTKLQVYLAVYDEKGENLTVQESVFPIAVPAGQEAEAQAGEFRPTLVLKLAPGAYTVTVTVRDPAVREYGTALRQVLVGEKKG